MGIVLMVKCRDGGAKMFFGLDLNQEGETLTDSSESRPWG